MTRALCVIAFVFVSCCGCHRSVTPTQFRVTGPSMGSSLPGPHLKHHCGTCQFVTPCDPLPGTRELVCPNCGAAAPIAERHVKSRQLGTPVHLRMPGEIQRWRLAAFPHKDKWLVKRVLGLPGEQVTFQRGDLMVDGRRMVKSNEDFRRIALLVHDDQFRADHASRWFSHDADWQVTSEGYRWIGREGAASKPLTYQHVEADLVAAETHQVYDGYGYNQGLSRQLNVVQDVAVCGWATLIGDVTLRLVARNGGSVIWDSRQGLARFGPQELPLPSHAPSRFWFGTWDGAMHLTLDDVELDSIEATMDNPELPAFRFEAQGAGTVELRGLQIYRDLYYAGPPYAGTPSLAWQLTDTQCFLLGDNVPRSTDSRADDIGPIDVRVLRDVELDESPRP